MRRLITASVVLALVGVVPAVAEANQTVTPRHRGVYFYLRRHVEAKFGHIDGRDILVDGRSDGRPVTDAEVLASNQVMERWLDPPRVVYTPHPSYTTTTTASSSYSAPVTYSAPASGLAACIVSRESGGNTQAVNGQYTGIAQWSPSAWAEDGGTQYASSPTGASYSQQLSVLNHALATGHSSQWTPYDGC